jgi:hypothetical protein
LVEAADNSLSDLLGAVTTASGTTAVTTISPPGVTATTCAQGRGRTS